jgi:RimJ/RimL family protein N-acetyltransferase
VRITRTVGSVLSGVSNRSVSRKSGKVNPAACSCSDSANVPPRFSGFQPCSKAWLITARAEGDCLTLAVVTDAGVIGTVELVWRSQVDRTAELGYVFHPDQGGRGLATEATAALLDWGFEEFGLHRVYARCHGRNEASARLMARLGMRQEAHHVETYLFRGEWADRLVFAILAREWRSRAAAASE